MMMSSFTWAMLFLAVIKRTYFPLLWPHYPARRYSAVATMIPSQRNGIWNEVLISLAITLCIRTWHFHRPKGERSKIASYPDKYYDSAYYKANRDKYILVHIEDTLGPVLLEEVIVEGK